MQFSDILRSPKLAYESEVYDVFAFAGRFDQALQRGDFREIIEANYYLVQAQPFLYSVNGSVSNGFTRADAELLADDDMSVFTQGSVIWNSLPLRSLPKINGAASQLVLKSIGEQFSLSGFTQGVVQAENGISNSTISSYLFSATDEQTGDFRDGRCL